MSEPKILHQNDRIEVIEVGNKVGIQQKTPSVIILPYTTDESGNPKLLGLISEPNPLRDGGISLTVITGSPNDSDVDILETAKRELKEESGYDVRDIEKWDYLGNIKTSKMVVNGNPAFGVDITGIQKGEKEGDGSKNEENSKFSLVSLNDAINLDDALVSCLFLKIFQNKLI
jgi:8-oxo-dGTP pyrophosphatase MutT (NUDIX family)